MDTKKHDDFIKERGRKGEKAVCDYLVNKGYKIVCTNYHSRYGEIDIIAENDKVIAFVEVKTRKKNSFVSGLESINKSKIRKIVLTLLDYTSKYNITKQPRIDCAQVTAGGSEEIVYIENAVDNPSDYL
ncbi:MAG: YraN family protein [Acutalibacteraceae bacterium]|nr:YraN family protein [Clostridia bacterium]MEE3449300.1 YraN family protein [Acutalibacteraceae bacterium]